MSRRKNLVHGEIALLTLKTLIILANFSAAFGARDLQRAEVARNHVALELLRLLHDMTGHILDLLHEFFAAELAVLHLAQFEFPIACEFWRNQFRQFQTAKQRNQ